ncbi:hypothetical protein Tco_1044268 [Tanacetum coccineum]|uniref:Aspartic peptidase DDI1-type domain-containing protein n=1 Tax=Tanacetum coccineum TaxID=301880 RepID=A0ABQ5GS05_9ASTR
METQANDEKLLIKLESVPVNTTLVKDIQKIPNYTRNLQELVSNKIQVEELSTVKLNARCSAVLQNELPPKEKDPGSFILPCIIGNTTVSNALTNLGASISVMPFFMFKRLGLGNPRPFNMVIEMADRSMQSLKGIVENVLVKIHRPMLATAHARIDVFGGKILLEVGEEQLIFNANEGATPTTISPVCIINDYDVIDNFGGPEDLEELLMNDDINVELGTFLHDNDLLPNFDDPGTIPPKKSPDKNRDPVGKFQDSKENMGIGIDDFVAIDNLWDDLDLGALTNEQPLKPEC